MKKYLVVFLSIMSCQYVYADNTCETSYYEELKSETCKNDPENLIVYKRVVTEACGSSSYSPWQEIKNNCNNNFMEKYSAEHPECKANSYEELKTETCKNNPNGLVVYQRLVTEVCGATVYTDWKERNNTCNVQPEIKNSNTNTSVKDYDSSYEEIKTESCTGDSTGLMVFSRTIYVKNGVETPGSWSNTKNECSSNAPSKDMSNENANSNSQEWTKYSGGTAPTCTTQRMLDGACVSDCNSGPDSNYNSCFESCFFYVDSCSKNTP